MNGKTNAPTGQVGASVSAGLPSAEGGRENPITSILPVGAFRTVDHAYYFNGKGPYPSVTTILDVLSKPALIQWKAQEAARAMLRLLTGNFPSLIDKPLSQEEELIRTALKEADKARDDAARIGSGVHLLADMVARDTGVPLGAHEKPVEGFGVSDEVKPYLEAFRGFLGRYSASSIVSSEKMVLNWEGYAGTYDFLMQIPHADPHIEPCPKCNRMDETDLWLIDIKTSKGFYPEYGLQLAGYRWADVIILEGNPKPYPMPIVHRTGVLHLRPDLYKDTGWRLIEYPTTAYDYQCFLSALKLYEWRKSGRFNKSNLVSP